MAVARKSIQEAFEQFHRDNPRVYDELVRLARRARGEGVQRVGIDLLFNVLRWERLLRVNDPSQDAFKLNDHYRSRYARLIMEQEADLAGMFEVRALRSHGPNPLYNRDAA